MTGKQCHPERSEGSRPSARCAMPIHGAVCSHASRRAAAGRYFLRLSMRARRCAPNAHASLRICLPAHTARTLYVVTPPDAPRSGRLARFTPARGRSITTPSQHVRPALRAARPRFAALLSPCAQGSALLIFSASLCQYKCCALVSPASLLGAPFLLRKTAPFSRPRRQSQFCPLRGTPRIPCAERRSAAALPSAAWPVYIDFACVVG